VTYPDTVRLLAPSSAPPSGRCGAYALEAVTLSRYCVVFRQVLNVWHMYDMYDPDSSLEKKLAVI
jgi:hypothetical protein